MVERTLVYVRLIEGSSCLVPVATSPRPGGSFCLLPNDMFDVEDSTCLLEFIPGDEIKAVMQAVDSDGKQATRLVATELVGSMATDADYWHVLFGAVTGAVDRCPLPSNRLVHIARRICTEAELGIREHYPQVLTWAMKFLQTP